MCLNRLFKNKVHPRNQLNPMQQQVLNSILDYTIFDDIDKLNPSNAARAYAAMQPDRELSDDDIRFFKSKGIWGNISQMRKILSDPFMQNRSTSRTVELDGKVSFLDHNGKLKWEKKGLLGLTIYNNPGQTLTRETVVDFINLKIVGKKIT